MEAIWSRTFPLYHKLRQLLKDNVIGEVKSVIVTFGQKDNHLPLRRLAYRENGGGTLFDWGVYCIQFILMVLGGEKPQKVGTII